MCKINNANIFQCPMNTKDWLNDQDSGAALNLHIAKNLFLCSFDFLRSQSRL